jgi:hypothetical protein
MDPMNGRKSEKAAVDATGKMRQEQSFIRGAATGPKSTYRAQLRERGAGQLSACSEGGGRARLARSDKPVQIFPGIPPLTFTAAVCNCERGAESNN